MGLIIVFAVIGLLVWRWIGFYNSLPEEKKKDFRISESDHSSDKH